MHCFVLLEVSFIQLKLNRVRTKQCYSISDFRLKVLSLARSGWESFLSHEGTKCAASCLTCQYWKSIWEGETERRLRLSENLQRVRSFRSAFPEFEQALPSLAETLPALLTKLYSDCQTFAETEINSLLKSLERIPDTRT